MRLAKACGEGDGQEDSDVVQGKHRQSCSV